MCQTHGTDGSLVGVSCSNTLGELMLWSHVSPRLSQRGLRVLVERCVHAKEFPQYEAFCPADSGAQPLT